MLGTLLGMCLRAFVGSATHSRSRRAVTLTLPGRPVEM
jgi:hypothetical protein